MIKEDDERKPRVKVYRDRESGMPKGDGLVTYLKDPSVGFCLLHICHVCVRFLPGSAVPFLRLYTSHSVIYILSAAGWE